MDRFITGILLDETGRKRHPLTYPRLWGYDLTLTGTDASSKAVLYEYSPNGVNA